MAVNWGRNEVGCPRATGVCDDCGREEVVAAKRDGHDPEVINRLVHLKWSFLNKTLRCPACEAARKSGKKRDSDVVEKEKPAGVRVATRDQRREIMDMLGDVYNRSGERYTGSETDASVADVLGVMVGWVAEIRDDFFGPAGGNEDMAALRLELTSFIEQSERELIKVTGDIVALKAAISCAKGNEKRLIAIEKAVGVRVMAKVR